MDWSFTKEHVWERHGVEVAWLTEELSDPEALVLSPDPASRSGRSIRTIGYSVSFMKENYCGPTHWEHWSLVRSNDYVHRLHEFIGSTTHPRDELVARFENWGWKCVSN